MAVPVSRIEVCGLPQQSELVERLCVPTELSQYKRTHFHSEVGLPQQAVSQLGPVAAPAASLTEPKRVPNTVTLGQAARRRAESEAGCTGPSGPFLCSHSELSSAALGPRGRIERTPYTTGQAGRGLPCCHRERFRAQARPGPTHGCPVS